MKTDSSTKTQLIVQIKCSFWCHLRETYVNTRKKVLLKHNAKARVEMLKIQILLLPPFVFDIHMYRGIHDLKSEKSYVFIFVLFINSLN